MHISIVDDKTEERRNREKKNGEKRSITFKKPDAQNSK
jgi:hypothetical protein